MKTLTTILLFILLVIPVKNLVADDLLNKKSVEIGIICDGHKEDNLEFINTIKKEVESLLGLKYKVLFPETKILNSKWQTDSINTNLNFLLEDKKTDIIIGLGPTTSIVLAKASPFKKPVIAAGNIQTACFNFPIEDNSSGIKNFTYLTTPCTPERDLEVFYSIYPFKKIVIILGEELPDQDTICTDIVKNIKEKYNAESMLLFVGKDYQKVIDGLPEDIDAYYLGPINKMKRPDMVNMIALLNSKKIPSFSMNGENDLEMGVMATVCASSNNTKLGRRIALNLEKIIEGEKVKNLPVKVNYNEELVINMKAVRETGFYPSVQVLIEARLINEEVTETSRVLSLNSVIAEALESNLEYKIKNQEIEAKNKEVKIARANLLPTVEASGLGVQIDEDRAKGSMGNTSERTITGGITFTQLIYSEQALANHKIQKILSEGREYQIEAAQLDLILNSSLAYIKVLMAKKYEAVRKENLNLTRKNLELAKVREGVGYTGISDVYRWESMLAVDRINLLYATKDRNSAEISLNQVLNKPLKQHFRTVDITFDSLSNYFSDEIINICLGNQKIYTLMGDFLVEESKFMLPEYKDITSALKAQERAVSSLKRSRYLPSIAFQAESNYILNRSGEGSNYSAPGDIPVLDMANNQIGYVPMEGMFIQPKDYNWNAGIKLSIPLAKGGERNARIQQAKIEALKLQNQQQLLEERLTQQIRITFEKIAASYPKINLAKEASEMAAKNLKITQEFYSQGMVSAVELIDAQNAAIDAKLFAVNAVYEYLMDLLIISRATGGYYFLSTPEQNAEFRERFNKFFEGKNMNHLISM